MKHALAVTLAALATAVPVQADAPLVGSVLPSPPLDEAAALGSSEWGCGHWGMYGRSLGRTFSASCDDSIDRVNVRTLVPAWFFKTPEAVTASPVVVDGVLYVGAWDGRMYALDAQTGQKLWSTPTEPAPGANWGPIVSSAAVADIDVEGYVQRLVFVGAGPRVYAFDADDGAVTWSLYVGGHVPDEETQVESSPVVYEGVVYVGMDTHNDPGHQTGGVRGGLLAIDAASGALLWRFDPEWSEADPDLAIGCGGVWSSPAIDVEHRHAVFGVANCYPANQAGTDWPTPYSVATVAVNIDTGQPAWSFQPRQPPDRDLDFGATPNVFVDADGRRTVGAGSKDGSYYALDPATGALRWAVPVHVPVDGIGGFIGSPAVWGGRIFGGTGIGEPHYFHAIDSGAQAVAWQAVQAPSYGASAVSNGVVFSAPLDSVMRAYDADTGMLLWLAPVAAPPSSGPAVVGDSVYVGAGTSSTDLCAKDSPYDPACQFVFDEALRMTGGIHAFRLAGSAVPTTAPSP